MDHSAKLPCCEASPSLQDEGDCTCVCVFDETECWHSNNSFLMRRIMKWSPTDTTCEDERWCVFFLMGTACSAFQSFKRSETPFNVHHSHRVGNVTLTLRDTKTFLWRAKFLNDLGNIFFLTERESGAGFFLISAVTPGAYRSRAISSCDASCCFSGWIWCCTPHTWMASFQCVWPCGPAERSSGWRPCHTECTWKAAHLQ